MENVSFWNLLSFANSISYFLDLGFDFDYLFDSRWCWNVELHVAFYEK